MFGASLLGAVVTAFCGPISFLGIAIPHLCRGLLGTSDHRALVPAVVLLGAAVALLAQMVSLVPGSAGVLPLNAVTSLIGAPIVVVVVAAAGERSRMTAAEAGGTHESHSPRKHENTKHEANPYVCFVLSWLLMLVRWLLLR